MKYASFERYSRRHAAKSPLIKDCFAAFFVGGLICVLGQLILNLCLSHGVSEEHARMIVPISLIFLACLLTGFGLFDRIAKFAGAGTLVPITGFANAMCSPSIDNKAEGYILGVGSKIFVIAGPVIVYGTLTSVLLGLVYWILALFGVSVPEVN